VHLEIRLAVAVDIALQQMIRKPELAGGAVKALNVEEGKMLQSGGAAVGIELR